MHLVPVVKLGMETTFNSLENKGKFYAHLTNLQGFQIIKNNSISQMIKAYLSINASHQ